MSVDPEAPFFPPELEREMFEMAAELYPETIPSLLSVAHRVYQWIERIKYRTVTPAGQQLSCSVRVLQRAIRSNSKPVSFFHDHVQHLFVPHQGSTPAAEDEDADEILSACSGIRTLALLRTDARPSTLRNLMIMRPRRLTIELQFLSIDIQPMFAFVTHLDLLDHIPSTADDKLAHGLSFLALLPTLTHLCLYCGFELSSRVLASYKKLEVLVCMDDRGRDQLESVEDPRFVYVFLIMLDHENDWVVGTKGGMDFWARGDAFVAKKRRGEIKPSSRCWIEEADGIGCGHPLTPL
ncbi:hypothetical protein B0H19DRAFT_1156692 [Mycena capillaripes]|nr:hypothetical protein B0H19DRAFT_1156692 [Mycena capillaripes]